MIKTCQKCGHQNSTATGAQLEACPACNAIYSRVEAAIAEGKITPFVHQKIQPAAVVNPQQLARPVKRDRNNSQPFIETLRENGHYPTFRTVTGVFALLGYVVAVLLVIAAVITGPSMTEKIAGVAGALFLAVICKFLKEAALMLADLSDAAVVIAEDSRDRVSG
jgi:hypothetical protein